jgi:mono/diheme cytochrome c family protein
MKRMALFTLTLAAALLLAAVTFSGSAYAGLASADQGGGAAVFKEAKCATCHSVSSAGIEAKMKGKMAGPDLTGVVADRGAGAVKAYLEGEGALDGKKHKTSFKGSDEELQALVDWLLEQKAE